ncbi:hypothetical protein UlMin_039598 [Ulmus minor]
MRMRDPFGQMLWLLFFISLNAAVFSPSWQLQNDDFKGLARSPSRSLLSVSPKQSTVLVAALDGTIHLLESNSKRVIWSFASGSPIHTSYQATFTQDIDEEKTPAPGLSGAFYIDCGDDWELYMHSGPFKVKLSRTIDEFIRSTPYTSDDGGVTLGSKTTTVFELDPKSGKLIRTYGLSDTPSTVKSTEDHYVSFTTSAKSSKELFDSGLMKSNTPEQRLQIIRTDYTLKSFAPNSDEVSWNMTVAEIGAALLCQDVDDPHSVAPLDLEDKHNSEIGSDNALPLSCQTKALIFRQRHHALPGTHDQDNMLPMSSSGLMLPSQHEVAKRNIHQGGDRDAEPAVSLMRINDSGLEDEHHMRSDPGDVSSNSYYRSPVLFLTFLFFILVVLVICSYALVSKGEVPLNEHSSNSDSKASTSKKKKNQKLEKSNGDNDVSGNRNALAQDKVNNYTGLDLNELYDCSGDGRRIGKLFVSNTEIAKGSNGTIVLEGIYEGRPVAVKRLVQSHHDAAFKEIQNLIASDRHPNIVRWYGVEYDKDFVYLSLERCACSLDDLIQIYNSSFYPGSSEPYASKALTEHNVRLESLKNMLPDVDFWKANGHPSSVLLKVMRDVVSGLVHLHDLGIIHRDLKPQNVLITKEKALCAKLSDMGISRRLDGDMSSLGHHVTGCGSSGWQAPEQLLQGRQTRAVDLFTLGCVLFFCITGGRHPFGDRLERDVNIVKNQVDLFLVEFIPEAVHIISRLLNPNPELRPKALEVLHHPLFWNSETRLSFLRDTSDRVELEDREAGSALLRALESVAPVALGTKWDEKMEPAFIRNIGHYRRYKYDSVRDLLRVMRNKLNHYRELPKEIQELVGSIPEGFDDYFRSRVPNLLIEVYRVIFLYCKEEECFNRYFKSNE